MCYSCYEEAGSPAIVTDKTVAIANMIKELYSQNYGIAGGNIHAIVDDWNLEDESLQRCLDIELPKNLSGGNKKQLSLEYSILNGLMSCTMDERYSAMAISCGIISI